jgi:hypothetical protein
LELRFTQQFSWTGGLLRGFVFTSQKQAAFAN